MTLIRWIAPVAVLGIVIALYIALSSTSPSIHEKPENWGVLAPGTETNPSPLPAVDWGVWQRDNPLTSDRLAWFRAQRFGMFVHWGIYAVPAGSYRGVNVPGFSEWILKGGKIPLSEYESYAKQFNPTEFRADELVRLAKRTGMGYLVVTAKHHDGFAMYDSAVSDFTVVKSTPYHHDPLADLAAACRAEGLPFGVFYSIMDWRHPQANKAGAEVYMTYMRAQLQELITRYDPAILWFDGQWVDWWSDERGMALEEFVHRLKPNIICNGRLAKTNKTIGDFVVTEHQPPGPLLGDRLWEMCQTTNASWGYKASDHQWKSLKELVKTLVDTTSSGGRLLLNVGPDARGKIPVENENAFLQVGAWLEKNGDSIFKSVPTKIPHPRWGRFMQGTGAQSHLIYATVYEWPTWPQNGELHLDANVRIRSAAILATNEALPLSLNSGGAQVMTLPEKTKGAIPVVIVLDMVPDPVSATPATVVSPTPTKTPP